MPGSTPASTCCSPTTSSLWYGSNRAAPFARALPPGVYGLSNELLDTPWPKLQRVRARLRGLAARRPAAAVRGAVRAARRPHPGGGSPDLARQRADCPPEWARALSAPFVLIPSTARAARPWCCCSTSGALYIGRAALRCAAASRAGETEFTLNAGRVAVSAPRNPGTQSHSDCRRQQAAAPQGSRIQTEMAQRKLLPRARRRHWRAPVAGGVPARRAARSRRRPPVSTWRCAASTSSCAPTCSPT